MDARPRKMLVMSGLFNPNINANISTTKENTIPAIARFVILAVKSFPLEISLRALQTPIGKYIAKLKMKLNKASPLPTST